MNSDQEDRILTAWDRYVQDDRHSIDQDGDRFDTQEIFQQRAERLDPTHILISEFLEGDRSLGEFRKAIDQENKRHSLWGFTGTAGLMNFNKVRKRSEELNLIDQATEVVRETIPEPASPEEAANRIERFNEFVDEIAALVNDARSAPFAGSTPLTLSYFWHIQSPDSLLPYHKSCRNAYKEIGIWQPSGSQGDRYASFWRTTDDCREHIEANRTDDFRLWDIEYAMQRYARRSEITDQEGEQPEVEEGTYTAFEAAESIREEHLGVDITDLHFADEAELQSRIETALQSGDHILLIGPPGTGKTKLAREICNSVGVEYRLTTATADWSTFDTIGGYRPSGQNELTFSPGVFLDCFQDDDGNPTNEWLIIDEINRADIDKAFGSLFSALTGDNVTLPFKHENGSRVEILGDPKSAEREIAPHQYYLPDRWRLIATMNTFDKTSLYEMSYAFMRRWAFIPVSIPDNELINRQLVDQYVEKWSRIDADPEYSENLATIWCRINEVRPIGPAVVQDLYDHLQTSSEDDYTGAVIMHVVPQLEGLRPKQMANFVEGLSDTPVDSESLIGFISDYFQISSEKLRSNPDAED